MSVQVSKWTKFFMKAGVPSGPANNYAVIFYDNRIQEDMLPDLSKEILRDMGITVMGDIIAILRHSKEVHAQSVREKTAMDMAVTDEPAPFSSPSPSSQAGSKRKSSAASRMVDHWINSPKSGENCTGSPVQGSTGTPTPTKKRLTIQANVSDKPQPIRSQKTLSERFSVKSSKVTPRKPMKVVAKVEEEHTLKVKMPQGSTERTKKLIAKQKQTAASVAVNKAKIVKKQSVFDRLGQESPPPLTAAVEPPPKKAEVKALKPLKTSVTVKMKKKAQTSVFSRLGGMASPPAPSQTTVQAVNPRLRLPSSEETPATIDYTSHSVLQPVKRKGVPAKPVKPVKPVKRSLGPTSSVDEKSVFARLGSKA